MFSSWPKVHLYWIQELGVQDVLYSCHVQCPTFLAISSFKTSKTIFTGHAQKSNIANIPKSYGISHTSEHWQRRVSQYQIHNYMLSAWWRGSNVSELVRRLERCELFQRSRIGTPPHLDLSLSLGMYPSVWKSWTLVVRRRRRQLDLFCIPRLAVWWTAFLAMLKILRDGDQKSLPRRKRSIVRIDTDREHLDYSGLQASSGCRSIVGCSNSSYTVCLGLSFASN